MIDNYQQVTLSIVIPLYNEEGNIFAITQALISMLDSLNETYEIILVDDGSVDKTWLNIKDSAGSNENIKGLSLSRNFGHQHALLAGLENARGKAIISMDGDLQHPPHLIIDMFEMWKKGYEIVNTIREDHNVTSFYKRITSQYFYKFFSAMTGVGMSEGSSDFRLIDRLVLTNLLKFQDEDLFLRGAVNWLGFSQITIPFKVGERYSGTTKYTFKKMFRFAKGAIISFSTKPLIIGVWIGLITSLFSFLEIIYIIIEYFQGTTVPGWASTITILSFLFGVLFIILGIIGTYIARIHNLLQKRPRFILSKSINIEYKK